MKTKASNRDGLPESFLAQFGEHVTGFLSGFDRLRFRATLRPLFQPGGLEIYLSCCKVLIKDFSSFAQKLTERVKEEAYGLFRKAKRPIHYLPNAQTSKELLAQELAKTTNSALEQGAVALFACVEPCLSFQIRGDRQAKRLRLVLEHSKCTHLYHYYQHPEFGLMHVRVQTWFPFTVDICLNGRQWLAHQMDQAGIAYRQCDNCFVWVEDFVEAQKLLDRQLQSDWPALLQKLLILAHPLQGEITGAMRGLSYYWSASQTEFATDIVFDHAQSLQRLYPHFLLHGIRSFQSPDVLRFLGKKVNPSTGKVHANFKGQVTSSLKERPEGVRLRHTVNGNSLKMYDKFGNVLRIEATLIHPEEFKVYRPKEGDPEGPKTWRELRRGVADLHRRAEVSQAANNRYLLALASVTGSNSLHQEAASVCQPVFYHTRRYRGLNPLCDSDYALLQAVSQGQFILSGSRNRDLRALLYKPAKDLLQRRRQAAAITRKLTMLRAHGLLRKIPHSHHYQLTPKGRRIITALLAACHADVEQLTKLAA
jgi:hypothetical protein